MSSPSAIAASRGNESLAATTWALAAVATGIIGGMLALRAGSLSLALVVTAVAAAVVVAATIWRLEFGLAAMIFTLPLDRFGRVPGLPVTVYQVLLVVVLASWGLRVIAFGRKDWLRFSALDVGWAALMGAALWSLPHSLDRAATVTAMVRLAFLWLFTLAYANGIRDDKTMRRMMTALLVSAVLVGLLGIGQEWGHVGFGAIKDYRALGGGVAFSRAGGLFKDPNQLGTFMSVAMVMALAGLVHERRRQAIWWAGWLGAIGVTGLALVASLSRTAWAGAAVGVVLVVLTAPRDRRAVVAGTAAALVLAGALFASPFVLSRLASSANVSGDRSVATRYYMTQSTLAMIRDNPVWGTGLDAFSVAYPAYRLPGSSPTIVDLHQLPLAFPVEEGIAGVLAEMTLLGAMVALFWRRRPQGWTVWEGAALSALLAMLVQTFFQYYLYFEYLWLILAFAVVAGRLAQVDKEEAR